jgi:hypothetical protein
MAVENGLKVGAGDGSGDCVKSTFSSKHHA